MAGDAASASRPANETGHPFQESTAMTTLAEPAPGQEPIEPVACVHTGNFPALLRELGVSLAVTTYQAGKLVLVRPEGDHLNTHFRAFDRPMGMAYQAGRLAVGCGVQVWEFVNVPAVAPKVEPTGTHDACFLPRRSHITGDIDIHEMAFGGDRELWFINTRFSCLCTLEPTSSFVPRWRPPFVSGLAPEDRCHLNGLAMVDGRPRYVTALGTADAPRGWRTDKARGGVLIDVAEDRIVLRGLSMPHSPRLYQGRLWLEESGSGSLGWVEPPSPYHAVCALPGFTRGLDFAGPVAFVGLSQVRESATFSGIPLTERLTERVCGVYCVHTGTGEVLAFLHFTKGVQEIFAVHTLPGMLYPDLLNEYADELLKHTYVLPDDALRDVPEA
jgi:uncharacterized protein (TIGR03032 family)